MMDEQDDTQKAVEAHAKMLQHGVDIMNRSEPGDSVTVAVDSDERLQLASNASAGGLLNIINALTVQVGRALIEHKQGRTDVGDGEAFLIGSMAVAKSAQDAVQRLKAQRDAAENGQGGKHYADDITDVAAANDGGAPTTH